VPRVRTLPPPADSLSLSRKCLRRSRTPAFRAGVRGWLGDRVGRDAQGFPLHANPWVYLCRTIFQYRSTANVVARMPRWSPQSWVFSVLNTRGSLNSDRAWLPSPSSKNGVRGTEAYRF